MMKMTISTFLSTLEIRRRGGRKRLRKERGHVKSIWKARRRRYLKRKEFNYKRR